jgi:hypothetical protein
MESVMVSSSFGATAGAVRLRCYPPELGKGGSSVPPTTSADGYDTVSSKYASRTSSSFAVHSLRAPRAEASTSAAYQRWAVV